MQTLVAIKDGLIATTIDNWDLPDRAHLQAGDLARIQGQFGDTVTFETVNDDTLESREARNLQPGWTWDSTSGTGTEPEEYTQAKEELDELISEKDTAKDNIDTTAISDIAAGSFAGTTDQALQVLATALKFFVIRDIQESAAIQAMTSTIPIILKKP